VIGRWSGFSPLRHVAARSLSGRSGLSEVVRPSASNEFAAREATFGPNLKPPHIFDWDSAPPIRSRRIASPTRSGRHPVCAVPAIHLTRRHIQTVVQKRSPSRLRGGMRSNGTVAPTVFLMPPGGIRRRPNVPRLWSSELGQRFFPQVPVAPRQNVSPGWAKSDRWSPTTADRGRPSQVGRGRPRRQAILHLAPGAGAALPPFCLREVRRRPRVL
jgi:hypothetical protein